MKVLTVFFQITVLLVASIAVTSQSSIEAKRSTPIGLGDVAPDFTLLDQNGHKITLSDARGKSPVLLVFYRGYW